MKDLAQEKVEVADVLLLDEYWDACYRCVVCDKEVETDAAYVNAGVAYCHDCYHN